MLTFGSVKKSDPMTSMSLATNESPETMGIMRSDSPLANQALLLILVLTNHCTTTVNPYRHSLFACLNSLDKTPVAPSQLVTLFQIDFNALFLTMCQVVSSEPPTLLLYLILHRNQHFKKYVMQRPDLENLVSISFLFFFISCSNRYSASMVVISKSCLKVGRSNLYSFFFCIIYPCPFVVFNRSSPKLDPSPH